jgi:hypothetical protein
VKAAAALVSIVGSIFLVLAAHISTGCGIGILSDGLAVFGLSFGYVLMVRELFENLGGCGIGKPTDGLTVAHIFSAKSFMHS